MNPSPPNLIRVLATRFKGKLSPARQFDSNVCVTTVREDRPGDLIVVEGEPFSTRLSFLFDNRAVGVYSNSTMVRLAVIVSTSVLPMSFIKPERNDRRVVHSTDIEIQGVEYPVFTIDGTLSSEQREALHQVELLILLEQLITNQQDSLHLNKGEIIVYLQSPSMEHVLGILGKMSDLASRIGEREVGTDLREIPNEFQRFIPLIKKWAVGDDSERDELVGNCSAEELRKIVEEVGPHMNEIDDYLDSFDNEPLSEPAAALGRLAEFVAEAKLRL